MKIKTICVEPNTLKVDFNVKREYEKELYCDELIYRIMKAAECVRRCSEKKADYLVDSTRVAHIIYIIKELQKANLCGKIKFANKAIKITKQYKYFNI